MGHVALYRRFRPSTFDEVVEQKHAVAALRQAVISGAIAHAYLFSGTRGTGKTSIAKIFSRAVNCLSPRNGNPCNECEICRGILDGTLMDVIEMDAASNNSVDNIRRVCDEVMFLPSRAKFKVYIIDEVHMLSGGAFNALLKTLEEPPAHAIFILATTEPHRIPATIISRCQRYDFRRIPTESMIERLQEIADVQHVSIEPDALAAIANLSDGAMRDAISLLDQVSTGTTATIVRDDILKITGVVDDTFLYQMAEAILSDDAVSIISLTEQLVMDGRDIIRFTLDLAHYFRDVLVVKLAPSETQLIRASSSAVGQMRQIGDRVSERSLTDVITRLSSLISELKWSPEMRTSFEIALLSFGFSTGSGSGARPSTVALSGKGTIFPAPPARNSVQAPRIVPDIKSSPVTAASEPSVSAPTSVPKSGVISVPTSSTAGQAMPASTVETSVNTLLTANDTAPAAVNVTLGIKTADPMMKTTDSAGVVPGYMAPPPFEPVLESARLQDPPAEQMPVKAAHETLGGEIGSLDPSSTISEDERNQYPEPPESGDYPEPPELGDYTEPPLLSDIPLSSDPSDRSEPSGHSELPGQTSLFGFTEVHESVESPFPGDSQKDPPLAGVSEESSALPLSELWDVLMHRWMDSMFTDVLQLKNASIQLDGQTFRILFPDMYGPYVRSLTARPEYKTIMKDIMMMINGVSNVVVCTASEALPASSGGKEAGTEELAARAGWINEMIRFAQEEGIPVETLDDL